MIGTVYFHPFSDSAAVWFPACSPLRRTKIYRDVLSGVRSYNFFPTNTKLPEQSTQEHNLHFGIHYALRKKKERRIFTNILERKGKQKWKLSCPSFISCNQSVSLFTDNLICCQCSANQQSSQESEGPFTLHNFFGTARIKMVRVPKNIARIPRLHILFSAMLTTVK